MREYNREMNQRALEAKEMAARDAAQIGPPLPNNPAMPIINPMPDISSPNPLPRRADPAGSVEDEDGKRNLISNEIQMFRDRFKDEDTKMRNTEKERKDRYERERVLQREKRLVDETPASGNTKSSVSPSSRATPPPSSSSRDRSSPRRDRNNTNRHDRSPPPNDDRYRNSSSKSHTSNSVRSRTNDRRSPPPPRHDHRSPAPLPRTYNRRSRTKSPVSKGHPNDEDTEEVYERKKQEKRLREKEVRYRDVSEIINKHRLTKTGSRKLLGSQKNSSTQA
jgi:RNA-binding protein 25